MESLWRLFGTAPRLTPAPEGQVLGPRVVAQLERHGGGETGASGRGGAGA
ncbi:hypothetical protein OWM54_43080 [Myxococcus sp. MISCRS1]|nr:hypothetical protein [Myxococcus sp. MISCRS1]MCY1003950.1 hypothetical protein [Myxococcus sp. MISCRS1]